MTATAFDHDLPALTTTRNPAMKTIRDTWLIFHRSLWLTIRQPMWLVFGMMIPILYLVFFGPLLAGATKAATAASGTSSFNWFVPGLLIQIAIYGTAFAGFGLIAELRSGVVERMRVTPMSRSAMLLGRSLRDVVILLGQAMLMIVLSIPFGLTIDAAGIAVALGPDRARRTRRRPVVLRGGARTPDRGCVRPAGAGRRTATAAAVGHPAADGACARLASVREFPQPADPRR